MGVLHCQENKRSGGQLNLRRLGSFLKCTCLPRNDFLVMTFSIAVPLSDMPPFPTKLLSEWDEILLAFALHCPESAPVDYSSPAHATHLPFVSSVEASITVTRVGVGARGVSRCCNVTAVW